MLLSYRHNLLHMLPILEEPTSAIILLDLGSVPTLQQHSLVPQTFRHFVPLNVLGQITPKT